jgi:hypothetical protein
LPSGPTPGSLLLAWPPPMGEAKELVAAVALAC